MSDCTFCDIVSGRLPSYVVLEDEHSMAFLDARPAAPGHTLVVPRVHAQDVWEISEVSHGQVAGRGDNVRLAWTSRPASTDELQQILDRIAPARADDAVSSSPEHELSGPVDVEGAGESRRQRVLPW